MQSSLYNHSGKEIGQLDLPGEIFNVDWNGDLVHQVITAERANQRQETVAVKDRSEVSGGGRKPWRQKGTGRARHGSIRSPIWIGGGVTHGPRPERKYSQKINRKMKFKALLALMSTKAKTNNLLLVEAWKLESPSIKTVKESFKNWSVVDGFSELIYDKGKRALVITPDLNNNLVKSVKSLPTIKVEEARNIDPLLVATYKYLIITDPEIVFEIIRGRFQKILGNSHSPLPLEVK
ncbi:MAG: 50S ribosomal protein L4 [Patescibacteria group bacterium]